MALITLDVQAQPAQAAATTGNVYVDSTTKKLASVDDANLKTDYAPLASPAITGTPTAPTAAADTNTTQLATTAFVLAQAASQAQQEAGSSTINFVTPGRQQFHPSAAKCWAITTVSAGTPTLAANYN